MRLQIHLTNQANLCLTSESKQELAFSKLVTPYNITYVDNFASLCLNIEMFKKLHTDLVYRYGSVV